MYASLVLSLMKLEIEHGVVNKGSFTTLKVKVETLDVWQVYGWEDSIWFISRPLRNHSFCLMRNSWDWPLAEGHSVA